MLTFIIPVRHPKNAKNWDALKSRLAQTMSSIANQTTHNWQAIIVANIGSDLPPLPERFSIEWVDYPPNPKHDRVAGEDVEQLHDFFRLDKGRRVRAGILAATKTTFFMIVDDDDFVSARLAEHVEKHSTDNGWYIERGYVWSEESPIVILIKRFFLMCGTSHIVRANLFDYEALRASETSDYVKGMLGSHISIAKKLADSGTPLSPLPFTGAVYRVGHAGAHSNSGGLFRTFIANKKTLRNPLRVMEAVLATRWVTSSTRAEFFGC